MSNYSAPTKHPITGEIKMADWLDDSFGHHVYGVRFHGEEEIYLGKDCAEISPDEMLEEIERMRSALRRIAHAPHGKVYCADGHEEAVLIARAALEGEKKDD